MRRVEGRGNERRGGGEERRGGEMREGKEKNENEGEERSEREMIKKIMMHHRFTQIK